MNRRKLYHPFLQNRNFVQYERDNEGEKDNECGLYRDGDRRGEGECVQTGDGKHIAEEDMDQISTEAALGKHGKEAIECGMRERRIFTQDKYGNCLKSYIGREISVVGLAGCLSAPGNNSIKKDGRGKA